MTTEKRGNFNPCGLFPHPFQWPVGVMRPPEAAECVLGEEDGDAYGKAAGDAHLQVQSPVVVDCRPDYALGDVVGHAEAPVRDQERQSAAEPRGAVVAEEDAAGENEHEAEVGKRGEDDFKRSEYRRTGDVGRRHVVEPVERKEADECSGKHAPPLGKVFAAEPPVSPYEHAEDEEAGSLEHAAVIPCPGQRCKLPFPQVDFYGGEEVGRRLGGECGAPKCRGVKCGRRIGGVGDGACYLPQAHGLQHKECAKPYQRFGGEAAHGHEDESHKGIQHQDFAGEECGVELTDQEQQKQAPAEPGAEVVAAHALVIVLNEETETEQQGENGIGFSAESEEQPVPDGLVGEIQPCGLGVGRGEGVEVEMLDGVEQDDGQHGKAAEHVGHVDAGVAPGFGCHFSKLCLFGFVILCVGCRFPAPEV